MRGKECSNVEIRIEIGLPEEIRRLLGINDDTVVESYVDGNCVVVQTIGEDEAKKAGF